MKCTTIVIIIITIMAAIASQVTHVLCTVSYAFEEAEDYIMKAPLPVYRYQYKFPRA